MEEIRRLSWNGKIPVTFNIAPEEFLDSESDKCQSFYTFLPRIGYLANFVEQIASHFHAKIETHPSYPKREKEMLDDINSAMSSLSAGHRGSFYPQANTPAIPFDKILQFVESNIWFSYKNQPLKWHYPAGVLFDFYGDSNHLPWQITIHFDNYPSEILLAPPVSRQTMNSIFMSLIKEADWLKHRGIVIEKMLPRDHRQLWFAFSHNKYETFWSINKKLMEMREIPIINRKRNQEVDEETTETVEEFGTEASSLKGYNYVPCRVYWEDTDGSSDATRRICVIQKLIKPFKFPEDADEPVSVKLEEIFLNLSPKNLYMTHEKLVSNYYLYVQGIECNLEQDVQEAYSIFSHPDNFLHLVARIK